MVDVGGKEETNREAEAEALLLMQPATLHRIVQDRVAKGDVCGTARLAGIMAAKETSRLIPLCHALPLTHVSVSIEPSSESLLAIRALVRTTARTGVEMEALTAASVAALTVYDMCKALDRGMEIQSVRLVHKLGGRSGVYRRCSTTEG